MRGPRAKMCVGSRCAICWCRCWLMLRGRSPSGSWPRCVRHGVSSSRAGRPRRPQTRRPRRAVAARQPAGRPANGQPLQPGRSPAPKRERRSHSDNQDDPLTTDRHNTALSLQDRQTHGTQRPKPRTTVGRAQTTSARRPPTRGGRGHQGTAGRRPRTPRRRRTDAADPQAGGRSHRRAHALSL